MNSELPYLTAVELAAKIRSREVSCSEVMEAHLAQIERMDPKVNAIPTLKGGSTVGVPSPPAIWLPDGRFVTPDIRDAERLQGFAVDWTRPAETVRRRSFRWKLVGNAVSVPVAKWVGDRLAKPSMPAVAGIPFVPGELQVEGGRIEWRLEYSKPQSLREGRDRSLGCGTQKVRTRHDIRCHGDILHAASDASSEPLRAQQALNREWALNRRRRLLCQVRLREVSLHRQPAANSRVFFPDKAYDPIAVYGFAVDTVGR